MKNLYLPKKLKDESVYYLKEYLEKKKRKLTKRQKGHIEILIKRKENAIDKEALLYEASSLLHLAQTELVRERKAERIVENGKTHYKIKSIAELVLKMLETVNLAHDKGYGDYLNTI